MIRKIIHIIVWLGVFAYLGMSLAFTERMENTQAVESIVVEISDSVNLKIVDEKSVFKKLKSHNLRITGMPVDSIDRLAIGDVVRDIYGVKNAAVFYTPNGALNIRVWQQKPVIRIKSGRQDYYLDEDNEVIKTPVSNTPRVMVATGNIDLNLARGKLTNLVKSIRENSFYSSLIQGIHVDDRQFLELIPRVGNHRIYLGEPEDLEWKLRKLEAFYNKAMPNLGWERYSSIDLRYREQVVCKKVDSKSTN